MPCPSVCYAVTLISVLLTTIALLLAQKLNYVSPQQVLHPRALSRHSVGGHRRDDIRVGDWEFGKSGSEPEPGRAKPQEHDELLDGVHARASAEPQGEEEHLQELFLSPAGLLSCPFHEGSPIKVL